MTSLSFINPDPQASFSDRVREIMGYMLAGESAIADALMDELGGDLVALLDLRNECAEAQGRCDAALGVLRAVDAEADASELHAAIEDAIAALG